MAPGADRSQPDNSRPSLDAAADLLAGVDGTVVCVARGREIAPLFSDEFAPREHDELGTLVLSRRDLARGSRGQGVPFAAETFDLMASFETRSVTVGEVVLHVSDQPDGTRTLRVLPVLRRSELGNSGHIMNRAVDLFRSLTDEFESVGDQVRADTLVIDPSEDSTNRKPLHFWEPYRSRLAAWGYDAPFAERVQFVKANLFRISFDEAESIVNARYMRTGEHRYELDEGERAAIVADHLGELAWMAGIDAFAGEPHPFRAITDDGAQYRIELGDGDINGWAMKIAALPMLELAVESRAFYFSRVREDSTFQAERSGEAIEVVRQRRPATVISMNDGMYVLNHSAFVRDCAEAVSPLHAVRFKSWPCTRDLRQDGPTTAGRDPFSDPLNTRDEPPGQRRVTNALHYEQRAERYHRDLDLFRGRFGSPEGRQAAQDAVDEIRRQPRRSPEDGTSPTRDDTAWQRFTRRFRDR